MAKVSYLVDQAAVCVVVDKRCGASEAVVVGTGSSLMFLKWNRGSYLVWVSKINLHSCSRE